MKTLTIDPEFKALIPPLSDEEREQLERNLRSDGCREPLVAWGETLLDGHNRYEICKREGIEFAVTRLEFSSREEAADWIDRNQLGRRNLDARQMSLLRGRRYNRTKPREQSPSGQFVRKGVTAESLAKEHGVDEKTIRRDGAFAAAVETLGIGEEVMAGKVEAPKAEIVAAAQSLGKSPTPSQVKEAIAVVKESKPKPAPSTNWHKPPDLLGKGIFIANEAIGVLKQIPKDDALRARGFELVTTWIKNNR